MNDISTTIVDQIEADQLNDSRDSIFDGIQQKAGEQVDMKRVEMSVDWAQGSNEEVLDTDND